MDDYWKKVEQQAWASYENAECLYHVAPLEAECDIEISGLISRHEEGEEPAIWFFTEKDWAAEIASSLGHYDFSLFSIEKTAIKRKLIHWDNVSEFYAKVSFYCTKKRIHPMYITFEGCFQVLEPSPPIHLFPEYGDRERIGLV